MRPESFDTVIVGAGQAGLGVSYELTRAGIDHLVLERDGIGQSWRDLRWDSFRLNTPAWMNALPGAPEPPEPDAFLSAEAWIAHLERHAFRHRLPVRCNVAVLRLQRDALRDRFRVETDAGPILANTVVVASGAARLPRVPALGAALPAAIQQVHTADYRRPSGLAPGAVLVVGGGQSGVQIVEDLLDAGRRVLLATSRVGRMPRRHRGRDVMAWLRDMGVLDERRCVLAGARTPRQPQVSGTRGGHTVSYQALERRGATLLGRLAGVAGHRVALGDDLAANVAHADAASAELRPGSTPTSRPRARRPRRRSPTRRTSRTPGDRPARASSTCARRASPPWSGRRGSAPRRAGCRRPRSTVAARSRTTRA